MKSENDLIAEYVRERHSNILGADFAIWKMGRAMRNLGKDIVQALKGFSAEDIQAALDKMHEEEEEEEEWEK